MPGIKLTRNDDPNEQFTAVMQARLSQKTRDLCFGNTASLENFKREVFSYRFQDKPNYEKLSGMLNDLTVVRSIQIQVYETEYFLGWFFSSLTTDNADYVTNVASYVQFYNI